MKALLQRVSRASVHVADQQIAAIEHGLLILLGVSQTDTEASSARLAKRVASYRLFADDDDKMNLDVSEVGGKVIVVSQFTLAADTRSGRRPSFSSAAAPAQAEPLYQHFCQQLRQQGVDVQQGQFGADMQVALVNDGPVTFSLEVD
ncbi:D-aminoacyl-tRNA deacylase [Idiomarina xiamenensis]|uniref:D-aminoacyl-tRNA deacylase n=1 Tax=Idiomarina xiamenensis 10-D-4 TaxID=740709 RepID=K2K2J5_9GAMM|nr:D-aminoacyl-tRNA deacylase [Idiomarina xiamenensis]EKE80907.1 D-tyrosyl-tRNA(Tyr) deacylase [Idiomarina xiamenensis 10-D-4]